MCVYQYQYIVSSEGGGMGEVDLRMPVCACACVCVCGRGRGKVKSAKSGVRIDKHTNRVNCSVRSLGSSNAVVRAFDFHREDGAGAGAGVL